MTAARPRIVCYGGLVLDLIVQIPRLPLVADEAQMSTSLSAEPGGVGNTLITAARLGGDDVEIIALGAAGGDPNGRLMLDIFRGEGIGVDTIRCDGGSVNSLVLVFVDDAGEHAFVVHDGTGDAFTIDEQVAMEIGRAGVFFVPGFALREQRMAPTVMEAVGRARASGVTIMNDLGPVCAEPALRRNVRAVVASSAVTMLTEAEALIVTGESSHAPAAAQLRSWGCPVVVVKRGGDGCTVWHGDSSTAIPAIAVTARDTTGAGDTFAGAFMVEWLRSADPLKAARYGSAAAAVVVQKVGAGRSCPTRDEVAALL